MKNNFKGNLPVDALFQLDASYSFPSILPKINPDNESMQPSQQDPYSKSSEIESGKFNTTSKTSFNYPSIEPLKTLNSLNNFDAFERLAMESPMPIMVRNTYETFERSVEPLNIRKIRMNKEKQSSSSMNISNSSSNLSKYPSIEENDWSNVDKPIESSKKDTIDILKKYNLNMSEEKSKGISLNIGMGLLHSVINKDQQLTMKPDITLNKESSVMTKEGPFLNKDKRTISKEKITSNKGEKLSKKEHTSLLKNKKEAIIGNTPLSKDTNMAPKENIAINTGKRVLKKEHTILNKEIPENLPASNLGNVNKYSNKVNTKSGTGRSNSSDKKIQVEIKHINKRHILKPMIAKIPEIKEDFDSFKLNLVDDSDDDFVNSNKNIKLKPTQLNTKKTASSLTNNLVKTNKKPGVRVANNQNESKQNEIKAKNKRRCLKPMIAKVTNPGEDFNLNELNLGDNFTNLNDDTQSESPQLNGKKPASLSNKSNKTKFAEKDENTTNNLLTNDINSTKRNLKLQELIEKQKNDKESGNIRRTRSGRAVIKPLEYWKNEEKELPKAISLKFSWGGNKVCILNEANNTMEARNTRKRRSRSKKDQGFLEDSTTTQKPVLRETRVHNNKGMKRKKEEPDVISPKDKKVATKKPKAAKKTNKIDLSVNKKELYNQTSNVKNAKQNGILKETQKIIKEQGAPSGNKGITYIERYKKALEAEDNETVIPRGKKVYQNANTMLNKALKGEVNYLFEGKVVDSEVDNSIDQKALSEFDIYEMSE